MSRTDLQLGLLAFLVLVAGCATTGQTSTVAPTETTTAPPPISPTQATPATTTQPTTVVSADRVPFSLRNRDSRSHQILVVIRDDTGEMYNHSVTVGPGGTQRILLLTGEGSTYEIHTETGNATFETNITLVSGLLQTSIVVNESSKFESQYVVN